MFEISIYGSRSPPMYVVLRIGYHATKSVNITIHAQGRSGLQRMEKYRNHEHYPDPTAGKALVSLEKKRKKKKKIAKKNHNTVIKEIFEVCAKHGYRVVGRIVLEDKETGEIWR